MAYGTSKAAVIHLTKQQAAELGEYGIRANHRRELAPIRLGLIDHHVTLLNLE